MKLSACGRRLRRETSILSAAAARRSLWALRYANAHRIPMATTTRLIVGGDAHPAIEPQAMRKVSLLAELVDGASHNKPFKLTARPYANERRRLAPESAAPQLKGNR